MKWKFRQMLPNEVESDITQRDQFRNDQLDLSDTVVREAVQNSLDAQDGNSQVRVRFAMVNDSNGMGRFLDECLDGQLEHAREAGLEVDDAIASDASALIIEDFGTVGLTGAVDDKDDENFSDFWRRHGKSHKTGKQGGRWGLGKLVYSYASRVGIFFGLTVRDGDETGHLMGQTVLNTHNLNGTQYAPHGFFADEIIEGELQGLQIPIQDHSLRAGFESNFNLERKSHNGLSIIIPYPTEELQIYKMIGVGVTNYFFPVLTGQLVLQFNDVTIDRESLQEVAEDYAGGQIDDAEKLFSFVREVHDMPVEAMLTLDTSWYDDWRINDDDFDVDTLEELRQRFKDHELIGLRLKLEIKQKDGEVKNTFFDLFLKTDPDLKTGHDLYVRGGITVPGESKFRHRRSLGALVAKDEAISSFLGDAENAAHTKWNARAEKLTKKYRSPTLTLSAIRNSLVQLHDLLAQVVEEEVEDALMDFFWTSGTDARKGKPRKSPPRAKVPKIKRNPKPFEIVRVRGGFRIRPTEAAPSFDYPITCTATVAYDLEKGNPFKKYSELDFDLADSGEIVRTLKGANITSIQENRFTATIERADFEIALSGFDQMRDIIVRVDTREA